MNVLDYVKNNLTYLDGGMGTLLQNQGLKPGELPERWNISYPEIITNIHKSYYDAGSNIICTNTFGANCLKFGSEELELIIKAAVGNAKKAREESTGNRREQEAEDNAKPKRNRREVEGSSCKGDFGDAAGGTEHDG